MLLLTLLIAAPCLPEANFPGDDWVDDGGARIAGRVAERQALEGYAFTLTGKDSERKGIRSDSALIVQGGKIVYEHYARGFTGQMRHIAWSVTKSVSSALVGAATLAGFVSPDNSLCATLPADLQPNCDITLRDVLEFGSGLAWAEIYENKSNQASSTLALLYGLGHRDRTAFVTRDHGSQYSPGTHFDYSTGSAGVLSAAVHFAVKDKLGDAWAWPLLFDRIGMAHTSFERDQRGVYAGGSHVWATTRDFARFGYLYLRDGCWAGDRVLPEDWVKRSTAISNVYTITPEGNPAAPGPAQGWQWWLNKLPADRSKPLAWHNVPDDAYAAIGHWGQYILVVPSLDMVIVRTGDDRDGSFDEGQFWKHTIALGRAP